MFDRCKSLGFPLFNSKCDSTFPTVEAESPLRRGVEDSATATLPPGTTFTTYNFAVAETHTYFVGVSGVWVHNLSDLVCKQAAHAARELLDNPNTSADDVVRLIQKHIDEVARYSDNLADGSEARHAEDALRLLIKELRSDPDSVARFGSKIDDLERYLDDRPWQEHHFATNKNRTYTPQMKDIADRYGLDLDQKWNKELLPHLGRHPNEYHEFVLRGMKQAEKEAETDKAKFLELFEKYVMEPVRQNPELLRKSGWE